MLKVPGLISEVVTTEVKSSGLVSEVITTEIEVPFREVPFRIVAPTKKEPSR
jgi:hypothetical protein